MAVLKNKTQGNFVIISQNIMRDNNLNLTERGLLVTLLSLPDGWNLSIAGWSVNWSDTRKNITFINGEVKRIRDKKLSQIFNTDVSKEGIEYEFERNRNNTIESGIDDRKSESEGRVVEADTEDAEGGYDLNKLDQAKRRDRKVYITDIAIKKVPYIHYLGFDDEMNNIMYELARNLLMVSKDENDSNEVAFTCDLGAASPLEQIGVSFGTEHDVNVLSDTLSNHLIVSEKTVAVVLMHNHPSTQTFSLEDIQFFLQFSHIKVIVVVSNQGTLHYIMRDNDYDINRAIKLFKECVEDLEVDSSTQEMYLASLSFLAKCSEAGLYYR